MKHLIAIVVMLSLAALGPAMALCSWNCAAAASQAAANAPTDACEGHSQHSTPHGGTKNCGGHPPSRIVAMATTTYATTTTPPISGATLPFEEQSISKVQEI